MLFLGTPGRAERLKDVLREDGLAIGEGTSTEVRLGVLGTGFELPDASLRVLADGDVFPEEVHLHRRRGRGARSFLSDFRDLKIGDLVVHQDHGIGRFEGLETLEVGGIRREFMVLVYQGGDKLKVPVESFDRVQKYASAEGARPLVDKLGSGSWEKTKRRVKKAMRDMAAELLKLYAERKARPGHAFTGESPWQREFEESFEYDETPDQASAIADVMRDMSEESPMDRLICGDVGYGKTEVAMRGAMRAVLDAKQVAVLTPTTILAFQHWKTFRKRFAPFPVRVEMVSRFRTAKEIKKVLADTAEGKVDVLIGTHRLLSKDVSFRDLGLLVIDEEQRFGVAAKEKLKHMRTTVDALTLSATPIPRTLQMGLAGIRDMSVIETPPKDRLAIQTSIVKFSTDVMATAVRQELARDGQVYIVHNRVESIYSLAGLVQKLVPEARVAVAHGQMPEAELEKAMLAFVEGRADVLVATTIIENGLDIPRANTMIINRADRYGLAQLYQLRGRVGRSERRASAYLMVPPDTVLSEIARKRLAAMREFSELGAGFRVAALDLELRGAGNLLGGEQSGHIEAVGLDLYVKLLEQTILELKGQAPRESPRTVVNLRVDLRIPEEYVPEVHQRMSLYKRVSQVRDARGGRRSSPKRSATATAPSRSRWSPCSNMPRSGCARKRSAMIQVDLGASALHLRLAPETPLGGPTLLAAVRAWPGASVTPAGVLRAPLPPGPIRAGRARRGPGRPGRGSRGRPRRPRIMGTGGPTTVIPFFQHSFLVAALVALACRAAPGPGTADGDPALLTLGDQIIRRSDFERHVAAVTARGGGTLDPAVRQALLEPYLEERVLVLEARARGLAGPGDGEDKENDSVRRLLSEAVLAHVTLSDAELDAHCRDHARDFDAPETDPPAADPGADLERSARRRAPAQEGSEELLRPGPDALARSGGEHGGQHGASSAAGSFPPSWSGPPSPSPPASRATWWRARSVSTSSASTSVWPRAKPACPSAGRRRGPTSSVRNPRPASASSSRASWPEPR